MFEILLIDHTKNRLFLAAEFLQWLDGSSYDVYRKEETGQEKKRFFQLFKNIKIPAPNKTFDLIIDFTDSADFQSANLIYPILESKKSHLKKDNIIPPFSKNQMIYMQPSLETAIDYVDKYLSQHDFENKNILISAGPTAEDIDPVRFLTNRSTGKMGIALSRAAFIRGANVQMIVGPVSETLPQMVECIKIRSAAEMADQIKLKFTWCDYFISAAAVADFTPIEVNKNKLKKDKNNLILELKRTADILQTINDLRKPHQKMIGFSVETQNLIDNSRQKMKRKNLDMIVANNPGITGAGFAADTNQVEIITEDKLVSVPLLSKKEIAHQILNHIKTLH
ncbi:MAG: bifunctional phosphopantothenoylcysteine decarboxylase/phosphopantothenate--cysteine ligase CoaBC [Calditrichaeota bacterium]|nr:bifunctional phosphopantothenoylcysteine decarboxylase/phosphopantothenate--cysteine ligase CoaBC [Calditrichota bacterium]